MLLPPLDKRNTCDRVKGLLGHFEEVYRGGWACEALALEIEVRTLGSRLLYSFVYQTNSGLQINFASIRLADEEAILMQEPRAPSNGRG